MARDPKDSIVRYDILQYFKDAQDALNKKLFALKETLQALADKYSRLDTVETGAEVNVINGVKVKDENITTVDGKVVTIDLGDYTKNEVTEVLKAKLDGIHEFASEVVVNPQREDGVTLAHISVNGEDKFIKRGAIEYGELEHIPATFPPSEHNHDERYYGKAETESKLDLKSDITHLHDDRYYTESEADNLLSQKSDIGHTHSQYLTAGSMLNTAKLQGIISVDNLPVAALERLVNVADDTARFALTEASVQLGDTVKVANTGLMYIIKDISKLNSEAGYEVYTAGSASSVPWSGVTGKPSSYTPSAHTHDDRYYTESEINTKLSGKSDTSHTHDDRYYTESEIDSKLSTKSPLIGSTSLSKLSSNVTFGSGGAISITQNDGSWWQRLRTVDASDNTQKKLIYEESQGNSGSSYTELFSVDGNGNAYAGGTLLSKNGHTHDDRYYTESEIDSKLAGKQGSLTATGSATKGMYIDSSGTAKAMTYSVNKDVPSDAKFTDTVYTHPTTAGNKHIPSGGSSGQILRWSADGTAVWGADNNTTYSPATQSANGLMSAADKKKLDGIATGANAYTHPNSGVTAGTYRSVTVNAQGHVTKGSNPTTLAGYGITDAPTKTGGGASGTWGISISGKANTAGTADKVHGIYTYKGGQQGPAYFGRNSAGFLMSNAIVNSDMNYKNWLYMDNYDSDDVGGATAFGVSRVEPRAFLMQSDAKRSSWNNYAELLSTYNYNTYAPKKDGTGASGTWGINISGNSATATKATQDSAGQQINTTYIKGLSVSGKTITYTKGDGTTGTITTQDTNTTYSAFKGATSSAAGGAGLVPAPTAGAQAKYLRADGTWQTPPDTNTTYSASNGISLSGTTFSNSGVRSIATGGSNGTISVNTNGTTTNVAVKGLGSAAYTASSAYAAASHTHPQDNNFIAHGNEFNFIPTLTANMSIYFNYRQTGGNNTSGYKITDYRFCNGDRSTDGVNLIAGTFNGVSITKDSSGNIIIS